MTYNKFQVSFSNVRKEVADFLFSEIDYYFDGLGAHNLSLRFDFGVYKNQNSNDNFELKFENGSVSLEANTHAALMIGFYRLLSLLGVGFVRPGKEHEIIPKIGNQGILNVELSLKECADYKHRGVCIEGGNSIKNILDFIDWLPKIGMNSFFVQFENAYTFMERWYHHLNNPLLEKEVFNPTIAEAYDQQITDAMTKRGIIHHRVGHGWTGMVLGFSSIYGWDQSKSLDPSLSWMVAEVNGKRELIQGAPVLTNLCLSNDRVIDALTDQIVNYCQVNHGVDIIHVWMADALNTTCECHQCHDQSFADQYIHLLNVLDQLLTERQIDTKICFLLYMDLLYPPQKLKLNNPERFVMMFAPITRTFETSYRDLEWDEVPVNREIYPKNKIRLPSRLEENLSFLKAWQTSFSGDSFIYDYPLGRAHYGDFGYHRLAHIIGQDIQTLDSLGLDGYISCQELRAGMPNNLPNYLMGRLLWDKNLAIDTLIDEYYQMAYGKYWEKAKNILSYLSNHSSIDYFIGKGDRINPLASQSYSAMRDSINRIDQSIFGEQDLGHPIQLKNWKILNKHLMIVNHLASALEALAIGEKDRANLLWQQTSHLICQEELAIQAYLDVYRIHEIVENYTGLSKQSKT